MSLWFTDENNNEILLYANSKETVEAFKNKHNMESYTMYGYPSVIMCNNTFKIVKERQKEEFYKQKGIVNIPGNVKYMFGGADRIMKQISIKKKRKRGLLMPPRHKESSNRPETNDISTQQIPNNKDTKVITKEQIEYQLKKVEKKFFSALDLAIETKTNPNEVVAGFIEGQIYAYRLLLELIDK
ncbi:hypothetical protein [Romboutsia ilealis]|uniref:hypothetical protein n=1 Tax=Romboutsia ilealis TaxID=1115758 RepID=UPI00272B25E1|nr:hypothetical protein [Romboutsia ilealis]